MSTFSKCACMCVFFTKTSVALRLAQESGAESMTPDLLTSETEANMYGVARGQEELPPIDVSRMDDWFEESAGACPFLDDDRNTDFFISEKPKLHNHHVAFVGDSTMRQQYYNLASWLMLGKQSTDFPATLTPKSLIYAKHWKEVFEHQNAQLTGEGGAHEICHCGRETFNKTETVEDRFTMLPSIGTNLSFFGWFGDWDFHGYFDASQGRPTEDSCPVGSCRAPFKWTIENNEWKEARGTVELLERVVMKLSPTPTHVIINTGLWGSLTEAGLKRLFSCGQDIRRRTGTIFIWKTTTKKRYAKYGHNKAAIEQADLELKLASQYGWLVFDAYNLTRTWDQPFYRDDFHARECKVSLLNRDFVGNLLVAPNA